MTTISLTVNGRKVSAQVEPRLHLADFLRDDMRLTGTHLGCEHGVCGACTVLIGDAPVRSCITYAIACEGLDVRTIEGFEDDPLMQELREAFSREHGLQCGFCTAGMLISSRDIVRRLPHADERRIRAELAGNLCRCTGYLGIVKAVSRVVEAQRLRVASSASASQRAAEGPEDVARQSEDPIRFIPAAPEVAARSGEPSGTTLAKGPARHGWTHFEESFVISAGPPSVWRALADYPMVAACLPGAELTEYDERSLKGRLRVRLGPISASFAGSATVQRNEAAMTVSIKGAGSDSGSRSRTRGELDCGLAPEDGGRQTRVAVAIEYDLQGPLAQFSRSGLAREFGRRVVAEFAANLNARLGDRNGAGSPPRAKASLDIFRLLWSALRHHVKRWFG